MANNMKKENSAEITMELTEYMEKLVKDNFDCEIEMLQGNIAKLADGRKRFEFVMDAEKAEPIRQFMMRLIIKEETRNYN